jgi:hypothetical protein
VSPRFAVGDVVQTRATNPEGHTRLPEYLCGRAGTIAKVHGLVPLADDRARGASAQSATRETLYTVVFQASDVWRDHADKAHSVSADLWDSYLERSAT